MCKMNLCDFVTFLNDHHFFFLFSLRTREGLADGARIQFSAVRCSPALRLCGLQTFPELFGYLIVFQNLRDHSVRKSKIIDHFLH